MSNNEQPKSILKVSKMVIQVVKVPIRNIKYVWTNMRFVYSEFYELIREYDVFCTVETKLDKMILSTWNVTTSIIMPRK